MRSRSLVGMVLSVSALAFSVHQSSAQVALQGAMAQSSAAYGKSAVLPLTFEANQGQVGAGARFLSRGKGYTAFLTAGGMVLSLRPSQPAPALPASNLAATSNSQPAANAVLQFKLLGAAQNPMVVGEQPLPGFATRMFIRVSIWSTTAATSNWSTTLPSRLERTRS